MYSRKVHLSLQSSAEKIVPRHWMAVSKQSYDCQHKQIKGLLGLLKTCRAQERFKTSRWYWWKEENLYSSVREIGVVLLVSQWWIWSINGWWSGFMLRTWQPSVLLHLPLGDFNDLTPGCGHLWFRVWWPLLISHILYWEVKRRAKATLKELQSKRPHITWHNAFWCIIFFRWIDNNSIKKLGMSMEYYVPMIFSFFSMKKAKKYFNCWPTKSE